MSHLAEIASARQRARRALGRLRLTPSQARTVGQLLRDERRKLEAARQMLAECRRELRQALTSPVPDSAAVFELTVQERVLRQREGELAAALERSLAGLLRPEQAVRLRALTPTVLGDVLGRLGA
jgi:Spy/CpxP family protein refolding chaperone